MKSRIVLCLLALALACGIQTALAASANIVALGASWTYGSGQGTGVDSSEAYPALLETLLKAKGIEAHVTNAGIPGDSTGGMYARLGSAVPDGTQLVIVEVPLQHETGETDANVAMIVSALKARNIKVVMLDKRGIKASPDLFDGGHPNARGQAVMAARLLPKVIAAIGRK
jgi:acyl-CoA thioesterase-1